MQYIQSSYAICPASMAWRRGCSGQPIKHSASARHHISIALPPVCCSALPQSPSNRMQEGEPTFQRYSKRTPQSSQPSDHSRMTQQRPADQHLQQQLQQEQQQAQEQLAAGSGSSTADADLLQMQSAFASMSEENKSKFMRFASLPELDADQVRFDHLKQGCSKWVFLSCVDVLKPVFSSICFLIQYHSIRIRGWTRICRREIATAHAVNLCDQIHQRATLKPHSHV